MDNPHPPAPGTSVQSADEIEAISQSLIEDLRDQQRRELEARVDDAKARLEEGTQHLLETKERCASLQSAIEVTRQNLKNYDDLLERLRKEERKERLMCIWESPLRVVAISLILSFMVYIETSNEAFVEAANTQWPALQEGASLWAMNGSCNSEYVNQTLVCDRYYSGNVPCYGPFSCAQEICKLAGAVTWVGVARTLTGGPCSLTETEAEDKLHGTDFNKYRYMIGAGGGGAFVFAAIYFVWYLFLHVSHCRNRTVRRCIYAWAAGFFACKALLIVSYCRARAWVDERERKEGEAVLPEWFNHKRQTTLIWWSLGLGIETLVTTAELVIAGCKMHGQSERAAGERGEGGCL